jgi:hypothetical protein
MARCLFRNFSRLRLLLLRDAVSESTGKEDLKCFVGTKAMLSAGGEIAAPAPRLRRGESVEIEAITLKP